VARAGPRVTRTQKSANGMDADPCSVFDSLLFGRYPPRRGSPTAWARSCTGPWSSSSSCRRLRRLWAVNMLARQRHTSAPSPSTPPPPAAPLVPTLPGSHSSRRVPFFLQTPRQALHGPGWLTGSARSTLHCPGRGEAVAAPVTTPSGREHKQRSAPRHFVASSARPGLPLLVVQASKCAWLAPMASLCRSWS
jgi:hypothetical protein